MQSAVLQQLQAHQHSVIIYTCSLSSKKVSIAAVKVVV